MSEPVMPVDFWVGSVRVPALTEVRKLQDLVTTALGVAVYADSPRAQKAYRAALVAVTNGG